MDQQVQTSTPVTNPAPTVAPAYGVRRFRMRPPGRRPQDWINLVLAIWLFISPWVLTFGHGVPVGSPAASGAIQEVGMAAWNAWVLGVIVGLLALSALSRVELWQEWFCVLLGAWIFAAPWALGFAGVLAAASWDHWIVGAIIFLVSLWNLGTLRRDPAVM